MKSELNAGGLDNLIRQYEDAATMIGVYTESGDYKKGDREYIRLKDAYREIRRHGREGQSRHLSLLDSDVLSVRVWAAAHALEYAPEVAEPVLEYLSKNAPGIQQLNAEMTLREWRAGRLSLE